MASSWSCDLGEVLFLAHTDGWSESPKLAYEVVGYPGGDSYDIIVSGKRETPRNVGMLLDSKADYDTLVTMLGESGYLTIEDWDTGSRAAVLVGVDPQPTIYSGGFIIATGRFIL